MIKLIALLFLLLLAAPQELAAQDFVPKLFRTGKFKKLSCGKMEAYNQKAAYRKHKKGGLGKLTAKRTKAVEKDKIAQTKPGDKLTPPPATNTTKPPQDKTAVTKPAPKPETPLPLAKLSPTAPKMTDSTSSVHRKVSVLTREQLKRMTLNERRDTLQRIQPEIVLPPIQFITAQDEFSVVNMDSFMQAMEYAQQGKIVLIEGHTDDLGSDAYNLKLSIKRAEKIRQLLLSGDIGDELISVVGYGESMPVVPNTSEENRSINRRIEFKIFSLPE